MGTFLLWFSGDTFNVVQQMFLDVSRQMFLDDSIRFSLLVLLSLLFFLFRFFWQRLFDGLAGQHLIAHGGVVDEGGDDDGHLF